MRFRIFDFARSQDLNRYAAGFTFGTKQAKQRNFDLPIARQTGLATHHKTRALCDGFEKADHQISTLHFPIRHRRAGNLIDIDICRKVNLNHACLALRDLDLGFRDHRSRILAQAHQFSQRPSHSQSETAVMVLSLPAPRKREWFRAAAVCHPFAFAIGFRFFCEQPAADFYVHIQTREL